MWTQVYDQSKDLRTGIFEFLASKGLTTKNINGSHRANYLMGLKKKDLTIEVERATKVSISPSFSGRKIDLVAMSLGLEGWLVKKQ